MYIVDKHQDFYDYYSHIYGEDKQVVFDRRGSKKINDVDIIKKCIDYYKYNRLRKDNIEHILLEIGNKQYIIKLTNFIMILDPEEINLVKCSGCDMELMRVYEDNKHYFDTPISIRGCSIDNHYKRNGWNGWRPANKIYHYDRPYQEAVTLNHNFLNRETKKNVESNEINNPILANTQLTQFLDPEKVWIELQTYISSLDNDKDVSIPMTDVEKAEQYGFDKKTSFRNPIK